MRLPPSWRFDATASPAPLVRFWPAAALGVLVLPYCLFPFVGAFGDALAPSKLWDSLWPVLAGGVLALGLASVADRMPRVPTGDTIAAFETAFDRPLRAGALFDRLDATFRRWPAAGLALLAIVLALAYATASAG